MYIYICINIYICVCVNHYAKRLPKMDECEYVIIIYVYNHV